MLSNMAIADDVTIRFIVQSVTMIFSLLNVIVLYRVTRIVRRVAEEQQYILDYRKELEGIRKRIKAHEDKYP